MLHVLVYALMLLTALVMWGYHNYPALAMLVLVAVLYWVVIVRDQEGR